MPRVSPYDIKLSGEELESLEARARSYTSQYRDVVRAKVILMAAQGMQNKDIAERLDMPRQIVSKWRKRFSEERLCGLEEKPRGGRPGTFSPSGGGTGESPGV